MGLAVADTSVLIAALDPEDSLHAAASKALAETTAHHTLVASVVAYAEVMVGAIGLGARSAQKIDDFFDDLVRIEPVSRKIARRASELRAKRGVRLPDALILATAQEISADVILTCDRRWVGLDRRVRKVG